MLQTALQSVFNTSVHRRQWRFQQTTTAFNGWIGAKLPVAFGQLFAR